MLKSSAADVDGKGVSALPHTPEKVDLTLVRDLLRNVAATRGPSC
ncbi:hypothetical protein ACIQIG_17025 [Streptomyces bacillaris]